MIRKPLVIHNDEELMRALNRAEDLMGCTIDSQEERELAELETAINDYVRALKEALARAPQNDNDPSAR